MSRQVREATVEDVPGMVELSERYRRVRAEYEPLLWSEAEDSRERHLPYLAYLVGDDRVLSYVHLTDGTLDGFVIGTLAPCPPVYAAGLTCNVDDFCVATASDWQGIGRRLLDRVRRAAKARGARQVVVVCPYFDEGKRVMLASEGMSLASEWYTAAL